MIHSVSPTPLRRRRQSFSPELPPPRLFYWKVVGLWGKGGLRVRQRELAELARCSRTCRTGRTGRTSGKTYHAELANIKTMGDLLSVIVRLSPYLSVFVR